MSRGARWTLGSVVLLLAGALLYSETISPSKSPLAVLCVSLFCVAIAIACFSQSLRGPAVRVLGGTVFLFGLFYLAVELGSNSRYTDRTHLRWIDAIRFLCVFGLPGLYVALRGTYPLWGRGAKAFLGENKTQR